MVRRIYKMCANMSQVPVYAEVPVKLLLINKNDNFSGKSGKYSGRKLKGRAS